MDAPGSSVQAAKWEKIDFSAFNKFLKIKKKKKGKSICIVTFCS